MVQVLKSPFEFILELYTLAKPSVLPPSPERLQCSLYCHESVSQID